MNPTAGLGFKPAHFDAALACAAAGLWFEVHAENYMVDGGPRLAMLEAMRRDHPLSVHGVGLSLASDRDPDLAHLERLARVVERMDPFLVSEHLAWSAWPGTYVPDLLPFPRSRTALERIARNIEITQERLKRRISIENPALYMPLEHELPETEFLTELVRRTGCGLLVDVNNVYVSAHNVGVDARAYLAALPAEAISEIHLAGHAEDEQANSKLLIDTHAAPVCEAVWTLFQELSARVGPRPALIERDDNIPEFEILLQERERAMDVLHACAA